MSRAPLIRTSEYPYHITARSNNKEWFYVDRALCWFIFCKYLQKTQQKYNLDVHALLMMDNHIHMIVSTPHENIDESMRHFMTQTSKAIGFASGRINRVWGARYSRSLITTPEYYAHAYKYLFYNPIKACLVDKVEHYPWSSLLKKNYSKKQSTLNIQQRPGFDTFIPDDPLELRHWINKKEDDFYYDQVKKALKKRVFKFANTQDVKKYENFKKIIMHP